MAPIQLQARALPSFLLPVKARDGLATSAGAATVMSPPASPSSSSLRKLDEYRWPKHSVVD